MATEPELEVIIDFAEGDDAPARTRTPPPVSERPSVVDEPGEVTQTFAHTEYDSGAEDALKFMRAELIWRRGQRVTREMIEEIVTNVRLAARDGR